MNIYIHIPFCHSKCAYCAFLSHCDIGKEDEYLTAICEEIKKRLSQMSSLVANPGGSRIRKDDLIIETIYFGGGTPSMVKPQNIAKIIESIQSLCKISSNTEVTLECNPEDITELSLQSWHDSGVTRLSIGVQSLNDEARLAANRSLTAKEVLEKVILAQKYFDNLGVDLIAGLPKDTETKLLEAIGYLSSLGICHISLYDLETDNESTIAKLPDKYPLGTDEERAETLLQAWKLLDSLGYEQYEISNFAQNNQYCRHNLDFWHGKDYLGFGLGAVSRVGGKVSTNTRDIYKYLDDDFIETTETHTKNELSRTNLAYKLRLGQPLDGNIVPEEIFTNLLAENLIDTSYKLTPKGKLVSDSILELL